MACVLHSLVAPVSLAATGDGTPDGLDRSGAVAATVSGALRYLTRPAAPSYFLRWKPPTLTTPATVQVSSNGQVVILNNGQDYILQMPSTQVTSKVTIVGGRNVVMLGGYATLAQSQLACVIDIADEQTITDVVTNGTTTITSASASFNAGWVGRRVRDISGIFPAGTTITGYTNATTVTVSNAATTSASGQTVYFGGIGPALTSGRVVHIEGLLLDASGGFSHDGIAVEAPTAIVQIQNCRITGMFGGLGGVHADVIQNYGGWQELRIDHLTGTSDYQGLFLPPHPVKGGKVSLSNIDLSYWRANAAGNTITYLLWMAEANGSDYTQFAIGPNVYIANNRSGQSVQDDSVYPTSSTPSNFASSEAGGLISFPNLPLTTGSVIDGPPPGGPATLVPATNVGLNYVSPGYGPAKQPGRRAMLIEEATTNCLLNPVPSALTDWSAYQTGTTLTQDSDANGNRLHCVMDGTIAQQGIASGTTSIVAATGQTWTASAILDGDTAGNNIVIEIIERTSTGSTLATHTGSVISLSATPTRYSFTFTLANASTARVSIRIRQTGTGKAFTMNARKLQMDQKGYATTYADGTLGTGYAWTGTANNSTSTRAATRVQFPVASHVNSSLGAVSLWFNLPTLVPSSYLWSVGTPNTTGQDFIGVRVNSAATGLELVTQTGTSAAVVISLGPISAATWTQVNATWAGTAVAGAINDGALSTGTRTAVAGSLNTPIEVGGLTDGTARCNGYVAPFAAFLVPLRRAQFAKTYRRTGQWDRSLLAV